MLSSKPSPKTSTKVLEAAAEGDQSARSILLGLAADFTARCAEIVTQRGSLSMEDAEEVANDTLLKIHNALESGKYQPILSGGRHAFHNYVASVFNNAVVDRVRKLSRDKSVNAGSLSKEEDILTRFEDEGSPQAEYLIDRESEEYTQAVCFALAMRSIDLVRRMQMQMEVKEDDFEAQQRQAAWKGFCLMVLDGKPRNEVIERLMRNRRAAELLAGVLTADWLSNRATTIRRQLWRTFTDLGRSVLPDASEEDLREGLAEMLQRVGYRDLASAFRSVADPEDETCEQELGSMDELLAKARASLNGSLPLRQLTEQLVTRATKLSHH
jgi:DNA-directed RNA polymerase specialized sigma24 family protein